MELLSRFKTVIGAGLAVVIAFFVYSYFFAGPPQAILSSDTPSASATVDQDLINLLVTLRNIRLDDGLFSNPAFRSFQDFGKDLVAEPVGRPNPFAPLGSVSAPVKP